MKRTIISLVVFASMFVVGAVPNAQAQQNQECSNASLQGAYGFKLGGFRVPAGTPFEVLGRRTFDGTGNFTAKATGDFGGVIIPSEFSGTYTVNADCTGTFFAQGMVPTDFVVVDGGNEYYENAASAGGAPFIAVFSVAKRQFRRKAGDNQ